MKEPEKLLQQALHELVPGAFLRWQSVPSLGLEAFLLDLESASQPLDTRTSERVMNAPPFWGLLWPAGHLMARISKSHPSLVEGRRCVDLGCGSGLVSVVLAQSGARAVAADSDPSSLCVTELHLKRHRLEAEVTSCWKGSADLLILADFLYDETNLQVLSSFRGRAEEIVVIDSRLEILDDSDFQFLGVSSDLAYPDLDPHREFGTVRAWYRGTNGAEWAAAFAAERMF